MSYIVGDLRVWPTVGQSDASTARSSPHVLRVVDAMTDAPGTGPPFHLVLKPTEEFAGALYALEDGEIRDRETAEIAMGAAVTGHLVQSTIGST